MDWNEERAGLYLILLQKRHYSFLLRPKVTRSTVTQNSQGVTSAQVRPAAGQGRYAFEMPR